MKNVIRSKKGLKKEARNGVVMPRKRHETLSESELLSRTIRTPGFSYERKTSQVHILCGSTYALDASPSQADLCLPPAMATISSPQGCSVGPLFSHKHLECSGVQPSDPVPERQAQVP